MLRYKLLCKFMSINIIKRYKFPTIIPVLFFAVIFLSPLYSQAAGIVPCGTVAHVGTPKEFCRLCDIAEGVQNLMIWATGIMLFVGLTVITIAGVMYMVSAGNPALVQGAKAAIKNVLIGAIFLLGAWVIVNTTLLILGADIGAVTGQAWWQFGCP